MSTTTLTTADKFEPLKTDCLGRVKLKADHREALLDAFDSSSLPATRFAALHGVNYQTFATWVQKRKRERGQYPVASGGGRSPQKLLASLVELELPAPATKCETEPSSGGLLVEHPSGVRLTIVDESQAALAAALINKLKPVSSC